MDSTATIFDPNRFSEKATNSRLTQVWTALPGIIQKFDAGALTCEVQPAIKGRITQEDGSIQLVNMPLLLDCPVVFPPVAAAPLRSRLRQAMSVWSFSLPGELITGGS